jgi:2-oxoglutarate ferredoxin oxidoreductase subunit beta
VPRPTHDQLIDAQIASAIATQGHGDLATVLASGETWTVE